MGRNCNLDNEENIDGNSESDRMIKKTHENTYLERKKENNKSSTDEQNQISIQINKETTNFDLYKGILFMFLSCIFRSFFSTLCKYSLWINKDLNSTQQIAIMNYFFFFVTLITLPFTKIKIFSEEFIKKDKIGLLVARNILAILSLLCLTYALKFMPISDVFSIFFIYPIFVLLFSAFLLKEKTWFLDYLSALSCLCGVIMIVKPHFLFQNQTVAETPTQSFMYLLIIAALFKSIEDITTRSIGKSSHFQANNLFYTGLGLVILPLLCEINNQPFPNFSLFEILLFSLAGICAWSYQTLATLAFQNESAGRVSMVNYLQVDFLYVIDLIIFQKTPIMTDLIGILLIFSLNFANGLIKSCKRIVHLKSRKDLIK
jgi:drug/metabolite transporter (DMT)-like permease